ncbi:MAG: hypothetical protein WC569_02245 [Candidatus Omnitrophota bacterium]
MAKIAKILEVLVFGVFLMGVAVIAEEITLTTYYPAPYGAYNELNVSQGTATDNNTSALTIVSTDNDVTAPLISASARLNGLRLDSNDSTSSYYILNIRSGAALTSRFYVGNDGNVGIGTDDPEEALDVNGTINATAYSVVIDGEATEGYSGTFTDGDGNTVTVTNGIITGVI